MSRVLIIFIRHVHVISNVEEREKTRLYVTWLITFLALVGLFSQFLIIDEAESNLIF